MYVLRFGALVLSAALGCAGCSNIGTTAPTTGPLAIPGVATRGAPAPKELARETTGTSAPVPCNRLRYMRSLNKDLRVVENPKTGDSLEYVVVGDGAKGNDIIVFFPGTGQDIADWPTQLITNSRYSPKIVNTRGYRAAEDGAVSLCHDYRLVFFDYPGVGLTKYRPNATRDAIASDVDAMLQEIGKRYGIATGTVDPLGWSLGTSFALKYAFLSPISRPRRKIRNVLLLAAGPGGSKEGLVGADSASCVQTLLDAAENATGSLARTIKSDATKLVFPYKGQRPNDNGTNSGCTANVSGSTVSLSVTPQCGTLNGCSGYIDNSVIGLETPPWKTTDGVSGNAYDLQRKQSNDFDVAYCAKAGKNFTSQGCVAYGPIDQSVTNGGVCKTDTSKQNDPVSASCDRLNISGKVTAIFGHEDLFTQWTYDRALVRGLNQTQPGIAQALSYPGRAGHGLLIQHPGWAQARLAAAMML